MLINERCFFQNIDKYRGLVEVNCQKRVFSCNGLFLHELHDIIKTRCKVWRIL